MSDPLATEEWRDRAAQAAREAWLDAPWPRGQDKLATWRRVVGAVVAEMLAEVPDDLGRTP